MVRRRHSRRKSKNAGKIWLFLSIAIASGLAIWFYSDIIDIFSSSRQRSDDYSTFKKSLKDYTVFGIDVSQYQGTIDWSKLKKEEKPDFVIIRATAGKDNKDNRFDKNWKAAGEQEILRGAYHYYRPDENSAEQANFFIKNVKLNEGDLPPVLDIEKYSRVQSLTSLKTGLLNWLKIVEEHYDVTPILYTYNKFYTSTIIHDERFDKYPLWIAWYNVNGNPDDITSNWVFWQFSDQGRVKGIEGDVDLNVFNGKVQDLDGLRIRD
jgi:lysozyme